MTRNLDLSWAFMSSDAGNGQYYTPTNQPYTPEPAPAAPTTPGSYSPTPGSYSPTPTEPGAAYAPDVAVSAPAPSDTAPSERDTAPSDTATSGTAPAPLASGDAAAASSAGHNTLAIDIGGTGLKASVLDAAGQMEHTRVRVNTPYPLSPQKLVATLVDLIKPLPAFDRVSVGFPGMVRAGQVLSAPHFVSPKGPGGKPSKSLTKEWSGFDLQHALGVALGKPTRVANDADLQGAAVVKGDGLEVVLTLGTGLGSALFYEGRLLPHLELAHHPFLKGAEYNVAVGDAARQKLGKKKWNQNVAAVIDAVRALTFFDHCYIGGGNAPLISFKLPADITLVDNAAGILGGVKLWDRVD